MFYVPLPEEAGAKQMQTAKDNRAAIRIDSTKEPTDAQKATAEKERVALANLQRMPAPAKAPEMASSTAIELNEFIGMSTTGLRNKPNAGADVMFLR
jgi:hypothetical protein